jgi:Cu-Zn family superoxide dismutase
MRSTTLTAAAAGVLALSACSQARRAPETQAQSVRTELTDASGRRVGDANLQQLPRGVLVVADLSALPSGTHAIHVHETGQCTPPFTSAGGHFNPSGARHGFRDPQGAHAGDLPNIHVPSGGALRVELMAEGLRLSGDGGLLDSDGAALVIHQFADDYSSDPAGAAGDRIACGALRR